MLDKSDLVVIGGGSAGFLVALRAGQLGGEVLLVEKDKLGGICANWGCIPMCFLTHCVDTLKLMEEAKKDGIDIGKARLNFNRLMSEKEKVVKDVVTGMEAELQAGNVQVVGGSAKLASPDQVEIELNDGSRRIIQAKKIVVAAGSLARRYEIPGAYGAGVLTAKELLDLKEVPKSLAIIGRSVTALELAAVWVKLGSKVTIIGRRPQILPGEDEELAAYIMQVLKDDGVHMYTGVDIERIDDSEDGKSITISGDGIRQKVTAQFAVFALGQSPLVDGLGLENAGIDITEGRIRTNERMETSVQGIYAVGDVTGEIMLASVAMAQGRVAAENAMGRDSIIDYRAVPRSVRTVPPMAAVGITEGEAKERGLDIKVGRFPFEQNPNASILRERRGFVKIIADSASGEILGVHIIGTQATELIHEAAVVLQMKGTTQDIAAAIHGHPCLHEAIHIAAETLCG
jgi:dihydrolipoamide dehydrogenase